MSGSREEILAALKQAASGTEADVDNRLRAHAANTIPARGQLDGAGRIELFTAEAERVEATVERLASRAAIAAAVARYLTDNNLPSAVKVAPDGYLKDVPWSQQPLLEVTEGAAEGSETAALSHAFAAVAETGTLVMTSSPDNPTTLNYLPLVHIVAVGAADIAGSYEEVWARIREIPQNSADSHAFMPRAVNWITGPSRTADIEQTLLLGAHGPQRLHILVIDDEQG